MFYKLNSLSKKIAAFQIAIMFVVLSSIYIIGYFTADKYFNKLQKEHIYYVLSDLLADTNEKILIDTVNSIEYISNDETIYEYHNSFNDTVLLDFLKSNIGNFSILSYFEKDLMSEVTLIDGVRSKTKSDFKNNTLYKEIVNNPNKVAISHIRYNDTLSQYVVEFAYLRLGYFENAFLGIIYGVIPISALIENDYINDKDIFVKIVGKDRKIVFSTVADDISKDFDSDSHINILSNKQNDIEDNYLHRSKLMGEDSYYMDKKLFDNVSTIIAGYSSDNFSKVPREEKKIMFSLLLILFIIIFIITYYVSKILTKPLHKMEVAVNKVKHGNFDARIDASSNDEIGRLIDSFNLMIKELYRIQFQYREEVKINQKKNQQLIEQSRLAQMGEMISMIAHQWRQPLAAISSTAAALTIKSNLGLLTDAETEEYADKISEYSQHLSTTIDDFRVFFKSNKELTEVSYTHIITSVLNIVETSLLNQNIKVIKILDSEGMFYTYGNELKQVILSIIKNSEDIIIEKEIFKSYIKLKTYQEDDKFILEISDNAGGVHEKHISKIFDPYFSTKKQKDGTGLGLYMSKIIIEEHCNGKLSVSNDEDGAVFKIVLDSIK